MPYSTPIEGRGHSSSAFGVPLFDVTKPHPGLSTILVTGILLAVGGCRLFQDFSDYPGLEECQPGETVSCSCPGGSGTRTCGSDGVYRECACADAGFADASGDASIERPPFRPLDGPTFDAVAVGARHTCAVRSDDGSIDCWGDDSEGQLGDPDVRRELSFVDVGAGGAHTCGVTTTEEVYCWGLNEPDGQLGQPTMQQTPLVPIDWKDDDVLDVQLVELGLTHSIALTTDEGLLAAWGDNDFKQSRPGFSDPNELPDPVSEAAPVFFAEGPYARFCVGGRHTCGLNTARDLDCWGWNENAQLGFSACAPDENPCLAETRSHTVEGTFDDVGCGLLHTCAVDDQRSVFCWGDGRRGQLGIGVRESASPEPVEVSELPSPVGRLGRSLDQTQCGWNDNGEVVCWGDNRDGQAHPLRSENVLRPTRVEMPAAARWVSSGVDHTCAHFRDGHVRCWGSDEFGQLGEYTLFQ